MFFFYTCRCSLPTWFQPKRKLEKKSILKYIQITGNIRVEDDGIRLHVKSRAGEVFDPGLSNKTSKPSTGWDFSTTFKPSFRLMES